MNATWLSGLHATLAELQAKAKSTTPSDITAIDHLVTQITRSMDAFASLPESERIALSNAIPTLMEAITSTLAVLSDESDHARNRLTSMQRRLQANRSYQQPGK